MRARTQAMLVSLGARIQTDDLVDLLAACHRRIRHHLTLARRLATAGLQSPPAERRDVAMQVRRYFSIGLPEHVADEDQTIAPRLRGETVIATLAKLTAQHHEHEGPITRLVAICGSIERDPDLLHTLSTELADLLDVLDAQLGEHLALEESVIFPALRALPASERTDIAEQIRLRRAGTRGA